MRTSLLLWQILGTLAGLIMVTVGYLYPVCELSEAQRPRHLHSNSPERGTTIRLMLLAACLSSVALLGTWGTDSASADLGG